MKWDAMILVDALRDPAGVEKLDAGGWTALITIARAEQVLGTLARQLAGLDIPLKIQPILSEARTTAEHHRRSALWEAECACHALGHVGCKIVLMKGTAYVAAGLKAGEGRHIGDLDIMVAHDALGAAEAGLLAAGWEWVKPNPYDDAYYRNNMHELPPLIHKVRDRMIDVHHTILPLTARPRPNAEAMLEDAIELKNGTYVFSPMDMVVHSAAHLFADGELDGGLRNLWDIHCMLSEFADANFWPALKLRAVNHQLWSAVHRATRLAHRLYGTDIPDAWQTPNWRDRFFIMRMTARDEWGRGTRKFLRLIFYIRGHYLRMPLPMLARHLWVKWRRRD